MGKYVARRLVATVVLVVLVPSLSFIYFTAVYVGGPVFPQLGDYLSSVFLHADFGRVNQPGAREVSEVLAEGIPVDLALLIGGFALGVAGGLLGGAQIARRPRSRRAALLRSIGTLSLAAPVYTVGAVIVTYFGSGGGKFSLPFVTDGGVYRPISEDVTGWLHGMWVPWLAISLPIFGTILRLATSATTLALEDDPVRTARSKGITDRIVLRRHALPFAYASASAYAGASMNIMILNAAIVERLFNLPGSFRLAQDSIQNVDFIAIQGLVTVTVIYVVFANLIADVILARIDPRVRLA